MEDAPTVANLAFVESLYERFLADPTSVPAGWQTYFEVHEGEASTSLDGGVWARLDWADPVKQNL